MKKLSILSCIIILALSCSNNNNTDLENNSPILIAKGILNYSESFNTENLIITNSNDWENLITVMESINENVSETFSETDIDFTNYKVIAVFDTKNSTTTIDIVNIEETENELIINIDNLQKGITQDIVHPYHIIKIKRSDKSITFHQQTH